MFTKFVPLFAGAALALAAEIVERGVAPGAARVAEEAGQDLALLEAAGGLEHLAGARGVGLGLEEAGLGLLPDALEGDRVVVALDAYVLVRRDPWR